MPLPTPHLLVFDLDGTLIDSQIDLANSVNAMLQHYGRPTLPQSTISGYIGDGAGVLVRRALANAHLVHEEIEPSEQAFFTEALTWFVRSYRAHMLEHTYLYSGVLESLTRIRAAHPTLPIAVLTNKPVHPSRDICAHYGLAPFFFQVYGGNSFPTKKPDPQGLQTLIAEASKLTGATILPAQTIMVGDSHVDIETARAAGAQSLGCTFGFSPVTLAQAHPDATVDHAAQWPEALGLA